MDYYNYINQYSRPYSTIQRVSDYTNQLHYPAFEQLGPGVTQQAVKVWSLLICL